MAITLHDIMPVGLCIATQELFDARRFRSNFCDTLLLRARDRGLEPKLNALKRELNSLMSENKFLDGHKTAIISNIDKILSLVSSRYLQIDLRVSENVISNGKQLIEKVLNAESFDDISKLEPEFKTKVMLPVYELFAGEMKKSKTSVI